MKREEALQLLQRVGCSGAVIKHSLTVERKAVEIAKRIKSKGHRVSLRLVSLGALLHDIGRAKTHGIRHGVEGAKILRRFGLARFAGFAERHLGAGIPAEEAKELGLPKRDFIPKTLEEKIVTYADKLVEGNKFISYREARKQLSLKLGSRHPALARFRSLHQEIRDLMKE